MAKRFFSVRQLHREFLRAGADVMQAFTFNATEESIVSRGVSIKVGFNPDSPHCGPKGCLNPGKEGDAMECLVRA